MPLNPLETSLSSVSIGFRGRQIPEKENENRHSVYTGSYRFALDENLYRRGVHFHDTTRLSKFMNKIASGQNVVVGALGTSIMAGAGARFLNGEVCLSGACKRGEEYPSTFDIILQWMQSISKGNISAANRATPATQVEFHELCGPKLLPENVDLVVIENCIGGTFLNQNKDPYRKTDRMALERLYRTLLNMQQKPAIIALHQYNYRSASVKGVYQNSNENDWNVIASYYGIPVVSVREAFYSRMVRGEYGFRVDRSRKETLTLKNVSVDPLAFFYWDDVHPYGPTGHKYMADMIVYLLLSSTINQNWTREVSQVEGNGIEGDAYTPHGALIRPMIEQNYERNETFCVLQDDLQSSIVSSNMFKWKCLRPDRPNSSERKCGWEASQPGAKITLQVDSAFQFFQESLHTTKTVLQVGYLRSYEHMGKAVVACLGGCACNSTVLDGHWEKKESIMQFAQMGLHLRNSLKCQISLEVLDSTRSGEYSFKISGLIIVPGHLWEFGIRDRAEELV